MLEYFQGLSQYFGVSTELLFLSSIGLGTMILFFGVVEAFAKPDQTKRRMRAGNRAAQGEMAGSLFHEEDGDPTGMLKAFVPSSRQERTKIARKMRQAGAHSKNAVRNFYLMRTMFGLFLPAVFIGLTLLPENIVLPFRFERIVVGLTAIQSFQILSGLIAIGFFGPSILLNRRIKKRRIQIEQALPNALDLLHVAVEAGLGFDAAISRIAHEMGHVAPAISEEFQVLQLEIQAGKDRDRAFLDMAARTDLEEMSSFVNVINQSAQFGTSVSDALMMFSEKMREDRQIRAQEMANKLPVKMSAVMAALMMPTLLMITLMPVVIRWINVM